MSQVHLYVLTAMLHGINVHLSALARTDRYWTSYSGYHREISASIDPGSRCASELISSANSSALRRLSPQSHHGCASLPIFSSHFSAYTLKQELSLDMLHFAMRQQEAAMKHANASNVAWREEQLNLMANLSATQLQVLAEVRQPLRPRQLGCPH